MDLQFGDPFNYNDYILAGPGQWFLGVLDTDAKEVYLVPSDREPLDSYVKDASKAGPGHIGIAQAKIPVGGWASFAMQGRPLGYRRGINSRPSTDPAAPGAFRQHLRVVNSYALDPNDCLGFALIKMTFELGEFLDRSNSLNSRPEKHVDIAYTGAGRRLRPIDYRVSPSGRSARMPEDWSKVLKRWLKHELGLRRLQDTRRR